MFKIFGGDFLKTRNFGMARLDLKATICHTLFLSLHYIKRILLVTNFQLVLKSKNHDSDNQYLAVVVIVVVFFLSDKFF